MDKEKGNIALLLIIVLVIVGAAGFIAYRYYLKPANPTERITLNDVKNVFSGSSASPKTASPKAAATTQPAPNQNGSGPAPSAKLAYLSSAQTALVNKYQGAYQTQSNTDGTQNVYYRGKVLKVVTDDSGSSVSFQPQDEKGNDTGKVVSIILYKSPLKTVFQGMVDKNLNTVDLKITYKGNELLLVKSLK